MKDIYELFLDMDIDTNEFEEIEATDIEKANVKKILKASIKKEKTWRKKAIVAATILVISTATLGITFPTYAANIPIIGDIFRALDIGNTGIYDNYKQHSNTFNIIKESNGIEMTLNEAVFDGKTFNITYTIKSEQDLGEDFQILSDLNIRGVKSSSSSGNIKASKVSENTYIAQQSISTFELIEKPKKKANISLRNYCIITTSNNTVGEIYGTWNYNLNLNAVDSSKKVINKSSEKNGIAVSIDYLDISNMSTFISYSEHVYIYFLFRTCISRSTKGL